LIMFSDLNHFLMIVIKNAFFRHPGKCHSSRRKFLDSRQRKSAFFAIEK